MSAEAAFLEALKANPADDTTRLVYADWLDEHDEHAKAEYLRLVVALGCAKADYSRDQPEVRRVVTISESLPSEWRTAAASRFKVVFYGVSDTAKKVTTIKAIREVSGIGLAEAAAVCELPPSELLRDVPFETALTARESVRISSGATILVHPCERTDLPLRVKYDIVATRWGSGASDDSGPARRFMLAFAEFLRTILKVSPEEASELARNQRVTLAQDVDAESARARVAELSKLVPNSERVEGGVLGVWVTPLLIPIRKTEWV